MRNSRRRLFLADLFANGGMNECVFWPFAVRKSSGYGAFDIVEGGIKTSKDIHRHVCELQHGEAGKGMQAAHACGQKLCVNPKHLYWATPIENMADAKAHGTMRGGGRYRQKISKAEAVQITKSSESHLAIAARFGVDPSYIGKLRKIVRATL